MAVAQEAARTARVGRTVSLDELAGPAGLAGPAAVTSTILVERVGETAESIRAESGPVCPFLGR